MILWVGMGDFKISPWVGINYYRSVVRKLGQEVVDQCFQIYVSPGLSHFQTSITNEPNKFDFFIPLENWVEKGIPPRDLVAVSMEPKEPFTITKSRPLCKNLFWPRYNGSGNPNLASSYSCVP